MKNNSPFFPTGTPIDRFYDKNGDGKLSGMETAFRDAALIQSHKASVKSSDSASNNNLSFSFRSGTNTGNGLGDSGFFAFSNEENQAEYVADEAEQAEDEDFLNDDDAVNTEEESDIYPVEAEDGSDDETPGEYEPEEEERPSEQDVSRQ